MTTTMKSPILEIRPLLPAVAQTVVSGTSAAGAEATLSERRICSLATAGECEGLLVAEVYVRFADGTVHRWLVCAEWLTGHPDSLAHIAAHGFSEPRSEKPTGA
ncbi:hypothetical protein [Streptomyces fructofermentans]|uniref:hypothetical protein n=2 Tax=Streptomyces fructofermentans TaxID=152141 RepID=UPI0037B8895B